MNQAGRRPTISGGLGGGAPPVKKKSCANRVEPPTHYIGFISSRALDLEQSKSNPRPIVSDLPRRASMAPPILVQHPVKNQSEDAVNRTVCWTMELI
jgi:hypothetical protein